MKSLRTARWIVRIRMNNARPNSSMTDHVHDGSVRSGHSAMRPLLLLALVALLLPTAGCRTFNSTQADLERERKQLEEGYAIPGSWGSTGGMGGGVRHGK